MKTKFSTTKTNLLLDELSPESRPTLSFENHKKQRRNKLTKAKLLEQFGIQV